MDRHNDMVASGAKYRSKNSPVPKPEFKFDAPVFKKDVFKSLRSISELASTHPARRLVEARGIPEKFLSNDLYLCESFYKFTNTLVKNKSAFLRNTYPLAFVRDFCESPQYGQRKFQRLSPFFLKRGSIGLIRFRYFTSI